MSNPIRTADIKRYFAGQLVGSEQKLAEWQEKYEDARVKYNQKIRHRWFGCKFEESMEGTLSWLHTQWDDMIWLEDAIKHCKKIINQCEYHMKCGDKTIVIDFGRYSEAKFYNWCKLNNIPY